MKVNTFVEKYNERMMDRTYGRYRVDYITRYNRGGFGHNCMIRFYDCAFDRQCYEIMSQETIESVLPKRMNCFINETLMNY